MDLEIGMENQQYMILGQALQLNIEDKVSQAICF